jgi:hypothetical protein
MKFLRKLRCNKRGGVAVPIAVIMSMIIVFSMVTNIFVWELALREEDIKRNREKLEIQKIYMSGSETHLRIKNIGSVTSQIVALWLNNTRYTKNLHLNAGEIKILNHTYIDQSTTFDVTVITERGLAVTKTYSPEPTPDVQEGGVFSIDWFYSQYTSQQNPTETDATVINKREDYVAFYLKVTNNWIYNCTLKAESFLTLVIYGTEPTFFVVKDVSYSGSPTLQNFEPIVTPPEGSAVVKFAAQYIGSNNWNWENDFSSLNVGGGIDGGGTFYTEGAGIQISLFFDMNGETYGQTISSQATILEGD